MFSFRESYFRLVGLFDWGYTRTQFLLLVSQNQYGFTLAGYQNEKSATDPALLLIVLKELTSGIQCITHLPPISSQLFQPQTRPYVEKYVFAYRCLAVYSAESLPTSIYWFPLSLKLSIMI